MRIGWLRCVMAVTCLTATMLDCMADTITFGSGANTFQMEFVPIGNPGNAADTTGSPNPAGSVGYHYGIAKLEVSEDMINKFNASQSLQITKDNRGTNKPATGVSWNEAARFVNWLNASTGNVAAYKFTTNGVNDNIALWQSGDAGYDASNLYRSSLAKYVLPSYNEWYKAAYYDPNKAGGAGYWDFPNGSDTAPTAIASGTSPGTAVYAAQDRPADVSLAGGLSPYGVMGLGGNVDEWEESSSDLTNANGSSGRGFRGGNFFFHSDSLWSGHRPAYSPDDQNSFLGFRVVSLSSDIPPPVVPEPSMMVIGSILGIGGLMAKRRLKKQSA